MKKLDFSSKNRVFFWSLLILAGTLFSGVAWLNSRKGGSMRSFFQRLKNENPVYEALVQQPVWLNTSRALSVADLQGRVILVDFWTFCCINCIHVLPKLAQLEKDFGHKLTVIGVHSGKFKQEKNVNAIRQAIIRYDVTHPVVNDADFSIWKSFDVSAWPTLVLINPDGHVERVYQGEGDKKEIHDDIEKLLKKHKDKVVTTPLPIALEKSKEPERILHYPSKLEYVDSHQGRPALFIADTQNNRILGSWMNGALFMTIGSGKRGDADGTLKKSQFNAPRGMAYVDGILYVADTGNHKLKSVDFANKMVKTLAGLGTRGQPILRTELPATNTALASPWDIVAFPNKKTLAIANAGTHQLISYDIKQKTISVLAGNSRESIDDGPFPGNSLSQPSGLSVTGDKLYFVDSETSSLRILHDGSITTLVGTGLFDFGFENGIGKQATLQHPLGVAATESQIFIADTYNHALRSYNLATAELTTVSGDGQMGDKLGGGSSFSEPGGIIVVGNKLFVADTNNHRIVVLDRFTKEVNALDIHFEMEHVVKQPEQFLPNKQLQPSARVAAGTQINISLELDDEWKINTDAPSWMVLYEVDGKEHKAIKTYDNDVIKGQQIVLPNMSLGKKYRLQATIYYCEKQQNPLCLLKSYDMSIMPVQTLGAQQIRINLNATG